MDIYDNIEKELTARYKDWAGHRQFEGTGVRLRRMVDELCWPTSRIEREVNECFKAVFPDKYDEMLVSGPTSVWTLCPHHLVPCNFEVHIGYIPSGEVLGLSKFSRVALILGKRPIMQEEYSRDVANAIMEGLKPKGVGVFILGHHGCIGCRGVNQDVNVSTSILLGEFKTQPEVRSEFYRIVKSG